MWRGADAASFLFPLALCAHCSLVSSRSILLPAICSPLLAPLLPAVARLSSLVSPCLLLFLLSSPLSPICSLLSPPSPALLPRSPRALASLAHSASCSGLHGYSHENPTSLSPEQQKVILDKTYNQIKEFWGKPPLGSVAPWWEVSKEGGDLLLEKGIIYGE